MSRVTKAIVPAAGLGTRLYPATKSQPKELLPLGTTPVIQMVAEELARSDVTDVLIVTGQRKQAIEEHFDPRNGLQPEDVAPSRSGLFRTEPIKFHYVVQSKPRGLGDAVLHGASFAGDDDVIVALGDCAIVGGQEPRLLDRMIQAHFEHNAAATIAVQRVSPEKTSNYGIVELAEELGAAAQLADVVEKPGPELAPSNLAICARYILSPLIFTYLGQGKPGFGGEIQLTDAIRAMIGDGHRAYAVPLNEDERRLDVGEFDSYGRGFVRALLEDSEYGPGFGSYLRALVAHMEDPSAPDPDGQ